MTENKKQFVKKFCKLIRENTMEYSDVKDITYIDDGNRENIYVTYKSDAQRKINVNCDSCAAIMDDFLKNVNSADWVLPSEKITPEPEDGNELFFDELKNSYSVEDFTGYIGTLLDENADKEDKAASMAFLQGLYFTAVNYL